MIASEYICIPAFATNNSLYRNIKSKVSTFALKKINDQYQKAKNATLQELLPLCPGSFSKTMGLLCAHFIQYLENDQSLMLNYRKYQEWSKFQQLAIQDALKSIIDEPSIALQDPSIVHTKGCPPGAPNNQKVNSTKRDPSGFKLIDPKARHCAIC
ncbi:16358_t:CDS:2 [Gigaspora margarita]|uniref:16358_t:CDS:1 n=1 Tax=Gigaspora margarita TaxID=4874 RepID=A0ABN7UQS2_GIGMA|nr:16358_t:CDS:2 [Gigaspora margarita]